MPKLPKPPELGLPEKFQDWRPNQEDAIQAILDPTHRVNVISAPTGHGKELDAVAAAVLSGDPTCIVTNSRGLQDQYFKTYASIGMVDIRGRSNYQCEMREDYTCEDGFPARCPYKGSVACPASRAEMAAATSKLVVTNYDKWTASRRFGQGMQHFTRVIFDEAHAVPDALARAMQVTVHHREIEKQVEEDFPDQPEEFKNWKYWAARIRPKVEQMMLDALAQIRSSNNPKTAWVRHFSHMKNLNRRLGILAAATINDWVVDEIEGGFQFDPIRPAKYAESALLLRVPKIAFISATIRPKTLHMVGLPSSSFSFHEYPSDFDPRDCPIYYVPTMRVDYRTRHDLSMLWARFDQIAARRRDRKGICHTVSYARRDELASRSRFYNSMLVNSQGEPPTEMVELFRMSGPGTILVSPVIGTGYDFPGKDCEWQFVCKIPYQPPSKIVKAREEDDREYRPYMAMQALVQMFGRGARKRGDRCENFICDDHWQWFYPKFKHLAPKSFHGFYKEMSILPQPPEALP